MRKKQSRKKQKRKPTLKSQVARLAKQVAVLARENQALYHYLHQSLRKTHIVPAENLDKFLQSLDDRLSSQIEHLNCNTKAIHDALVAHIKGEPVEINKR